METDDIPEELISPPEKRLVSTLLTRHPYRSSLAVTLFAMGLVVLITQLYWMDFGGLAHFLPAVQRGVLENGEWWRIFTATLIHGDLGHLVSNLYMLAILSFFVYGYFGWKIYPFIAFLAAGLVNLFSILTYPPDLRLLGASGLVYLLGGFWLTMYLLIQRQYSLSQRLLRVTGIGLMIFFPTSFEATTSYRTHFIGFFMGVLMGVVLFFLKKKQIRKMEGHQIFY